MEIKRDYAQRFIKAYGRFFLSTSLKSWMKRSDGNTVFKIKKKYMFKILNVAEVQFDNHSEYFIFVRKKN
jgi:hypothetical protein